MTKPEAYIHPEAKIGSNVIIEPFAYIDKDVEIDDGTWIGPQACIWEGARIGKHCKIYAGAQVSAVPQDMKFDGEKTLTIVGDHTSIREFVTISRGTQQLGHTIIGAHCLLMNYVHIAHDCILGDRCILSNTVQVAGHVEIGDHAVIGGMSAIRQFVRIGEHAMIAGGSLVRKDVPPYVSAAREPLGYSGINAIGLKRRGFTTERMNEIQEIYRAIYLSDVNTSRAIKRLLKESPQSEDRDVIVQFIQDSELGIMKGVE
ncbi:MAG: acyl-ACP--UDP-N-acetylglucosamine O-acyltransferase [Bacteroidota bacterium]